MANHNHLIADRAQQYLGVKEWPGAKSNPAVESFFAASGHPGLTDDIPWCAAFVGAVLVECGVAGSGSLMARSYENWGRGLNWAEARVGDVVVLSRGQKPSGHVGFFIRFEGDRIVIRGGNQGDEVNDTSFAATRIVAIRRADPSTASGRPTLRLGDRGAMVLDLQSQLRDLRRFSGKLDGDFGSLTQAAVLAFQADSGLEVDGIVGNRTWAALPEAEPKETRDVTIKDLRKGGSKTIKAADRAEATVALTGVAGAVGVVNQVADQAQAVSGAAERAAGALGGVQGVIVTYWPVLLAGAALFAVWLALREIKARRVADAQSGANVGR
jgi:uncharacterized protein (TIGR02594 family)